MSKNKEELKKIEKMQKKQKSAIMALVALAVILAGANLWTFFYYVPGKNNLNNSPGNFNADKYKFLDPARGIYDKKDLIVDVQPLRDELNKIGEDKRISIYFEFLPTGANIAVNKDAQFFPASLLKLPLAMTAVKKIERGEWKWENELVIMPTDKDERYGNLYQKPIGTKLSIEELVKEMLINSDNTAYLMILRNLEPDEFQNTQKHLGLENFFSEDGKISAKNYAVILRALYSSSYLDPEDSEKLIELMAGSKTNEYLSAGLPEGVAISHKIGVSREENVHLDAGIVYVPNRPYFLIVMINTPDREMAKKEMKEISGKIYNYIANYRFEN